MLKLFGKTLIERQIEIYQKCGIDDITIVTGYKSEMINFSGINYVKNQDYATTNMNESLFCASEKLSDSVIISYTDIVFEQKMIEQMLQFSGDIGVAISLNWKKNYDGRTLHPLSEAENVLIENEKIIEAQPHKDIVHIGLDTSNPYNLKYSSSIANYQIKGFRMSQPDSLKITLNIATK